MPQPSAMNAVPPRTRSRRRNGEALMAGGRSAAAAAAEDDRQFVTALWRGLEVLSAFRAGEPALTNQTLAERTGLPKPTVSRLSHTLMKSGFLAYNSTNGTYELGSRAVALGYVAIGNLDIRGVARPLMQRLADRGDCNVGLGIRQHHSMLHIETCEGEALVSLRLFPGSRIPLATTAMGRAYLAALPDDERSELMEELAAAYGAQWPQVLKGIERARRSIARDGYCLSLGEWQRDINGAGTAVVLPYGRGIYAFNVGGPAHLLTREKLTEIYGPTLARLAHEVAARMGNG